MTRKKAAAAVVLALALSVPAITRADIVINAVESGGDVVFSFSGSIDLTNLTFYGGSGLAPSYIIPSNREISFGTPPNLQNLYLTNLFPVFGSGGLSLADTTAGDAFFRIGNDGGTGFFGLATTYQSGSHIEGNMTFEGETFATLGLTPGTYVLAEGIDLPDDTITLNIGPAQVLEPATFALFGLGLAGLAFGRRKRCRLAASRAA